MTDGSPLWCLFGVPQASAKRSSDTRLLGYSSGRLGPECTPLMDSRTRCGGGGFAECKPDQRQPGVSTYAHANHQYPHCHDYYPPMACQAHVLPAKAGRGLIVGGKHHHLTEDTRALTGTCTSTCPRTGRITELADRAAILLMWRSSPGCTVWTGRADRVGSEPGSTEGSDDTSEEDDGGHGRRWRVQHRL